MTRDVSVLEHVPPKLDPIARSAFEDSVLKLSRSPTLIGIDRMNEAKSSWIKRTINFHLPPDAPSVHPPGVRKQVDVQSTAHRMGKEMAAICASKPL